MPDAQIREWNQVSIRLSELRRRASIGDDVTECMLSELAEAIGATARRNDRLSTGERAP